MAKMTKTEFENQANRAGINRHLYDVIIPESLQTKEGVWVANGHVIGIDWFDEWVTEQEYSPSRGTYDSTFLSPVPYVRITKARTTYHVSKCEINAYLERIVNKALAAMTAAALKKQKEGAAKT